MPGYHLDDALDVINPRHAHRTASFKHDEGVRIFCGDRFDECVLVARQ
jgi:hypothetical protein